MYLALYRKYRPRTFDDVISQEHITTTLKNQIINGSAAHAYLFTGSRGTGKTTCAKILAMAVNCLSPKDGSPCLECERCKEILDGTAPDIVEMDAASNNGVDDVRQLRDEVAYTPVSCKYRVYIIDEAHMLSNQAFNALLKTLEEPPPHVKFILATTEVHKIPATISSRCQRFEFRRVDIADSAERLSAVADKESVSLEHDAAELISRLSDGGMRDALSILDRCISADTHITSEVVRSCAGVADRKHLFAFSEMIARKDAAGCIRLLAELHKGSKDIALIMDELSGQFRDLMLYKTAPNDKDLLAALPDEYGELARIADMYALGDILRCLTMLQQCTDSIGKVKQRKTLAEMCFVRMCTGNAETVSAAGARPVAQVAMIPVFEMKEKPEDRPAPKPVEQMSQSERINSMKTRALLEETAKFIERPAANLPAEERSAVEPSSGIPDEPPPILDYDAPPLFDDSYPIELPEPPGEETVKAVSPAANSPKTKQSAQSKQPKQSVKPEKLPEFSISEITPEKWADTVSKLDMMTGAMLGGSKARVENGWLIVSSSNSMLLDNVKDDELARVEKELADVLNCTVHLIIEKEESRVEAAAEQSKLNKLMSKARQLGIDVKVKK